MKLLVVSSYLPYPLYSGGHIRLYNILKELSKKHSITLVCEKRDYQTDDDVREMEKICKEVFWFPRKKQWSINNILKTQLSTYPFLMVGHTNSAMKEKITDLLQKNTYDLVHAETFYIMQNIPPLAIPLVLAEHNVEYQVYGRFIRTMAKPLLPILYLDVLKMKYWEEKFWQKATKLIAVSNEEKKEMKKNAIVVSNGVDTEKFTFKQAKNLQKQQAKRILFIGDFKWLQNTDATEWIISKIWPMLSTKLASVGPQLTLWIVGKQIPEILKNMSKDPRIIFDENAPDDTAKIFQQADVLLAPIRAGGGTSYKILEAMATGVPVVTTELGIEGLGAVAGKEVLVADDVEQIVDSVASLLEDEKLYSTIARNARKLIEQKYNWKTIVATLEEVYASALAA